MTSPLLLQEATEALWEEKIRKYHRWDQEQLLASVVRPHRHSQVTPGQLQVRVIADDPDANAVLACAKERNAGYIVTAGYGMVKLPWDPLCERGQHRLRRHRRWTPLEPQGV